jgi:hypothetical protein
MVVSEFGWLLCEVLGWREGMVCSVVSGEGKSRTPKALRSVVLRNTWRSSITWPPFFYYSTNRNVVVAKWSHKYNIKGLHFMCPIWVKARHEIVSSREYHYTNGFSVWWISIWQQGNMPLFHMIHTLNKVVRPLNKKICFHPPGWMTRCHSPNEAPIKKFTFHPPPWKYKVKLSLCSP